MYPRLEAITVAVALSLTGCARSSRTPDDTLVVLIEAPMRSADPRYALSSYDLKLSRLVAPGLYAVDTSTMEPRLELAQGIERIDDLTYEVTLRPGLRFSDGQPLTADDVAWTYQSVLAEGSDSPSQRQFAERFAAVEAVSPARVRFRLRKPLATLLTDLDFGIVSRRAADATGHFPGGRAVGAGPYRLLALETQRVRLERNPHYHGTPPALPRVDIRVVRDASARILMLVGGSADLAQNAVRLDLVDEVAREARVAVAAAPSAILTYLLLNNQDPALADLRVRRAIAHAVDRDRIIAAKFGGRAVPATGLLAPGHWAYEPNVDRFPFDPARARALLDEAGLRDPDGAGPLPRLRLTYKTSSDQFRVAVARVIAAQLGEVGIAVEVRPFEFATFFADVKKGAYQLASMQTTDIGDPDYYFTYFHSSRIPSPQSPDGGNRWRYRNPRVDDLTTQGRGELDPGKRMEIYSEAQKIVASDVPIVPLWHEHNIVVANKAVVGYTMTPNARLSGLITSSKE